MSLLIPIESKMEVFARTYSRDTNVEVRIGSSACTDGKTILVPPIPDQADPYLRLTTEMFTYHETGHVMTKDFTAVIDLNKLSYAKGDILNWVRDVVVEHTMETKYPGMKSKWTEFLTRFLQEKTNKEMASKGTPVIRKLMVTFYARCREKQLGADLGLIVPKTIQELFNAKLAKFIDPALAHHKVEDSVKLAEEIYDAIKNEEPPKPKEQKQNGKGKSSKGPKNPDESSGSSGESEEEIGDKDPSGDGDDKDPSDSSDEESDSDKDTGSGGEESDQGDTEPEDSDSADGEGSKGNNKSTPGSEEGSEELSDSEPGSDSKSGTGEHAEDGDGDDEIDPLSNKAKEALKQAREEMEKDTQTETIMEDAAEQVNQWASTNHLYREDVKDVVIKTDPRTAWDVEVAGYEEEGRKLTGYSGQRMKVLFVSEKAPRWQSNLRSGRLDTKKLHRLPVGSQDVCRRKMEGVYEDSAVWLVIDNSSSMNDKKDIAQPLLTSLAYDLDKMRIPFGAVGFTICSDCSTAANNGIRTQPCYLNLMKDFDEPYRKIRHRFVWPAFTNMTAELPAIKFGAYKLAERRETKKVLFIITDGGTCTGSTVLNSAMRNATKEFIERLLKAGVKVVGIGIQSTDMQYYCPDFIHVQELDKFALEFYSKLTKLIL
jgi:cobalamin biosynthesis protein CobT